MVSHRQSHFFFFYYCAINVGMSGLPILLHHSLLVCWMMLVIAIYWICAVLSLHHTSFVTSHWLSYYLWPQLMRNLCESFHYAVIIDTIPSHLRAVTMFSVVKSIVCALMWKWASHFELWMVIIKFDLLNPLRFVNSISGDYSCIIQDVQL